MLYNNEKQGCGKNEIAVIGMAGRFPGAPDIDTFWRNLLDGVDTISQFSEKELLDSGIPKNILNQKNYIRAKGILDSIDSFDADFFGYPPREAERMDPQIRLLHECAWHAFENAGYNPENYAGLIGAYLGANENQEWLRLMESLPTNGYEKYLLNYRDYVATRIANKLNLKGPCFTLLTACSTSLVAVHLACQALIRNECDMAVAGGVSITLPKKSGYLYQDGLMVSQDGKCRTFDHKASGTVFGDGIGVVVLKKLNQAVEDYDTIHAVIKGSAINNDGNGKAGFTAPSVEGQSRVIRAALREANIDPASIGYIEAHGTGTRIGDPIEFHALQKVFGVNRKQHCGLGSVKTNIGHVNIAAGIASFIKAVLTVKHGLIPPNLHFKKSNSQIQLKNSSFFINNKLVTWNANGTPRRSGVSAFGFGGTNAHVILEDAPPEIQITSPRSHQIFILSGQTESALHQMKRNLADHFQSHPSICLADAAFTLSTGRKACQWRTACVAKDANGTVQELMKTSRSIKSDHTEKKVAFLFPGQGSQYIGMGKTLYEQEPSFQTAVNQCADILKQIMGKDIRSVIYPKNESKKHAEIINRTWFAQPAIFTISYAMAYLWKSWGIQPAVLLGHSIGEYVAACLAGVFSLRDALYLVSKRAELMESLPQGQMLSVPLSQKDVRSFLNQVELAAVNGPELCVVSGPKENLDSVKQILESKQIPSRYLFTSHAFHSVMMDPILKPFRKLVGHVIRHKAELPIISTVTGKPIHNDMIHPPYWTKNIRQPVLFSQAVQHLLSDSNLILLEVGPGRVLGTLCQTHPNSKNRVILSSIPGIKEKNKSHIKCQETLARLWEQGINVNWNAYYQYDKRKRIPLPAYPFQHQRFWIDGHHKKPNSRWETLQKIPDISDWFSVPSWKRSYLPIQQNGAKVAGVWLIFSDSYGLCAELGKKLENRDQQVIHIFPGTQYTELDNGDFQINPLNLEDYDRLFQSLNKKKSYPQRIIHAWNFAPPRTELSLLQLDKLLETGFDSLLFLSQILGKQKQTENLKILLLTNDLHTVIGNESILPEKAVSLGLLKVIPQEYPHIQCQNVDINFQSKDDDAILQNLIQEALSQTDLVVAYRKGQRWIQAYEQVQLQASKNFTPFKDGNCYLITGGLGGIGLVLARHLGEKFKTQLILTSRTEFPQSQNWNKWIQSHSKNDPVSQKIQILQKIENAGSEIMILSANITDEKAMRLGIQKALAYFGRIHGVIHAAGVSGEGIIQLKTKDSARSILAPKVQGSLILADLLKDQQLDFMIFCSSIASILGGIGLADYCAANSFLDSFSHHLRMKGIPAYTVNWDMWGEVGMGLKTRMPDELQGWLEKELRDGITCQEGLEVFHRLMSYPGWIQMVVSTRDLQSRIDLWIKREFIQEKERAIEETASKPKYSRPNLNTTFQEPENGTEKQLAEIWGRLFGIDQIGREDNFYELGGHSLLATTLVTQIKKEMDSNLSIRDVLDNPTIAELANVIEQ